ncbi:GTP 3',8-cyclase MoaA [Fuchsiella alkaliacetigena]|uniref:GTP 3',8-cyclase MoaA n=1 Tax=Fuchsiella alkaliacetigena TaxID=957042 RepID=UPI002009E23C|nr:GTP 3',8-cyclase MoaA [Fuchsiella alkaliacetigena]MCK8824406.1 GTP 3',8-cyclase MoaA [Fuchsiella alkaliacetigena]
MKDEVGRQIDYLRVSITDRCNLRCFYCMPEDGVQTKDCQEILRYEELYRIIKAATELGIDKVRLTGGEPLVRKGVLDFIERIKALGIKDLSLTTNGTLLPKYAADLKAAGLDRVNISLDTLQAEKFAEISRAKLPLSQVLLGIKEARLAGLEPLKLNVVLIKGINDEEIEDFAKLTYDNQLSVRFIELMPLGESYDWAQDRYISIFEIKERLRKLAALNPVNKPQGNGPAKYYRLAGAKGKLGFISFISDHFCSNCNRVRLTADGFVKPCLHADSEHNLKEVLRTGANDAELKEALEMAILAKPEQGLSQEAKTNLELNQRQMSQIGG